MPPARWTMIFLCCLANTINYIDRANLAVAAPTMQHELGIDAATLGLILGGFFWTYSVMQMPFGWFADRVGARISLSLAVVWWSVFTAFTAVAQSAATLLGCRLLLGVGEAGAYPSCAKVAANWFPRSERGLASSIFDSGSRIGSALSLPLVAWLIASFGWRASFIVTGLLGIIWAVFWVAIYRDPERHRSVTPEQLQRLQAERRAPEEAGGSKVSWASLFGYRTIWGMMVGFVSKVLFLIFLFFLVLFILVLVVLVFIFLTIFLLTLSLTIPPLDSTRDPPHQSPHSSPSPSLEPNLTNQITKIIPLQIRVCSPPIHVHDRRFHMIRVFLLPHFPYQFILIKNLIDNVLHVHSHQLLFLVIRFTSHEIVDPNETCRRGLKTVDGVMWTITFSYGV